MTSGQYRVYVDESPQELIDVCVAEKGDVVISGPIWRGAGHLTDGIYTGTFTPQPGHEGEGLHRGSEIGVGLVVRAEFASGVVVQLTWRPES